MLLEILKLNRLTYKVQQVICFVHFISKSPHEKKNTMEILRPLPLIRAKKKETTIATTNHWYEP